MMVGQDVTFLTDDGSRSHAFLTEGLTGLSFRRLDSRKKTFEKFFVVKIVWVVKRLALGIPEDFFHFDVDHGFLDILNQCCPGF